MAHYNIQALIKQGESILKQACEPIIGARYLMMDLFNLNQMDILLGDRTLSEEEKVIYASGIKRLSEHVPLAHITGFQMFYDNKFIVTPDVLVPRNETEELVSLVRNRFGERKSFVDIGTGSGAIAVTLSLELPEAKAYAVDISQAALDVAKHNAHQLKADVTFFKGDLFSPLIKHQIKVDCLVSNPPYIAESERSLMNKAALHDPFIALFAEDNGLALYKKMIAHLPGILNPHALVAFEIGHAQGEVISNYIQQHYPNLTPQVVKDMNGLDRILWFEWCE
ncbi:peptide chain release factor N(5)-glutamine methyltransferase [Macrococcoides caseolyticum]|uniref:peptide chain release factor N(5)-glutamine methyltransferase n=1 Tax=Macrococcoides caseolyticum TaxID=69966 RepID=UPI001F360423|nr:peptide chain release factor N(5)-glutamine methyltransferase [Macrococcus caseolyticus]MCE4957583.1 peptide chain release factor N(5)-glutamine methyltransferase [Macrococcus caseolyticus]